MAVQLDTTPFWADSAIVPAFPKLDRDERADVTVVGAGIAGMTAAYLLAAAGRSVVVLERAHLASIDSGHTTAHLTMVTDARLSELARHFGRNHAQAAWDSGFAALMMIDEIARRERIACDFAWVPGYLHAHEAGDSADQRRALDAEAALAAELGFDASLVDETPVVRRPGVRFENQARFHPRKYLAGLARAVSRHGGRIYEHSEAAEFSARPRRVRSNGRTVTSDYIVLATHVPHAGIDNVLSATLLQTKLSLYSTYAVAGRVDRGVVPDVLLWDTADPYHYFRLQPDGDRDLIIYGGEDHKTGQASDTTSRYDRLEHELTSLVPGVELTHRWSGQVVETHDGLPYIGETTEGQFACTGFSGNGMTFGTLAGMMATDRVLGRSNPWQELFDPSRKKLRGAAWDYIKENKDYPYYLVRDRIAGADGRTLRTVPRGEGRVVEYDGEQAAAYRDERGVVTLRSAICTHMGCLVDWNAAERTWDCPCHGSRFKVDGQVIGGPADAPLRPVRRA